MRCENILFLRNFLNVIVPRDSVTLLTHICMLKLPKLIMFSVVSGTIKSYRSVMKFVKLSEIYLTIGRYIIMISAIELGLFTSVHISDLHN